MASLLLLVLPPVSHRDHSHGGSSSEVSPAANSTGDNTEEKIVQGIFRISTALFVLFFVCGLPICCMFWHRYRARRAARDDGDAPQPQASGIQVAQVQFAAAVAVVESREASENKGESRATADEIEAQPSDYDVLTQFLGTDRSKGSSIPDMELNVDYQGSKPSHHGKVELFFRETRYAGYNVLKTAQSKLDSTGIPYQLDRNKDSFSGGEGQMFLEQPDYVRLCDTARREGQTSENKGVTR